MVVYYYKILLTSKRSKKVRLFVELKEGGIGELGELNMPNYVFEDFKSKFNAKEE